MVVEGAGPGWGGQERARPAQTRNAFGSSSSAPSPLASPAAALVELSQAATPTEGDLQMAPRIWDFSILTFAASIPLSHSFFGVWHDVSLSPGSPDFFPSVAGQEVAPMPEEGAGDHCMAGDHSPATPSEEWLLQAWRGHQGLFPSVLGTHCWLPTRP